MWFSALYGIIIAIMGGVISVAVIVIGGLVALFIFVVIASIFLRRSLTILSKKTSVGLFDTTELLLLIGAVLTIIAIGFILLWIALILLTVSFFSIKT